MDFLFLALAASLVLTVSGSEAFGAPEQYNFLSEIDNLSDESSDIQPQAENTTDDFVDEATRKDGPPPVFEDPKVYGMNIGLHFLLESINAQIDRGDRVHLESLIKVLVMTHNIEKVGGAVNENNRMALKGVSSLFPLALREAMEDY